MKKNSIKKLLCIVVVLVMLVAVFAACKQPTPTPEKGEKNATLVIVDTSGKITKITDDTNTEYVDKWLEELNSESKITLTFVTGTYGMNITSLNGIEVDGSSKYFAFYADDADNVNDAWGSYEYESKKYYSCAYGQSSMPVKNNCTYILVYTEYTPQG